METFNNKTEEKKTIKMNIVSLAHQKTSSSQKYMQSEP